MHHSLSVTISPVARGAPPRCAPCCPAAGPAHVTEHRTALRCASSSAAPAETAALHSRSSPAPAHQSVLPAGVGVSVASDSAVPEAHAGLHTSLYGQSTSGADVHDSSHSYQAVEGEDDGTTLVPVPGWLASREGAAVPGVYAVYDAAQALQLVSYSRNVVLSLRGHVAAVGLAKCAAVKVLVFANKAMATRAAMEAQAHAWLGAAEATPPGNGVEAALWGASQAVMTPLERAEYEGRKLKLQRAMGTKGAVGGGDEVPEGEGGDPEERRMKLKQALEGGVWSIIVDGQTEDIQQPGYVTSPFSRADVHRAVGGGSEAGAPSPSVAAPARPASPAFRGRELNVATAEEALNEVRPYLIADGGDVKVMSVENGIVALTLQGACGTCPSSSATMSMGIERALRSAFGDALKQVVQVSGPGEGSAGTVALPLAGTPTDVDAVRALVNTTVGAAISAMGGKVAVKSVERGVVVLGYKGPPALGKGIAAAVKDKFEDIRDVRLEDL